MKIVFEEQTYSWNGIRWLDSDGLAAPQRVAQQLNGRRLTQWWEEHADKLTPRNAPTWLAELRRRALDRDSGTGLRWLESIAQRLLERFPRDPYITSVLAACLRDQGQPHVALRIGMPAMRPGPSALRTTLAASLCDLKRWEEASKLLGSPVDGHSRAVASRINGALGR